MLFFSNLCDCLLFTNLYETKGTEKNGRKQAQNEISKKTTKKNKQNKNLIVNQHISHICCKFIVIST